MQSYRGEAGGGGLLVGKQHIEWKIGSGVVNIALWCSLFSMNNVVKLVSELEIQNDNVYFLFIIQSRDQAWWKKTFYRL